VPAALMGKSWKKKDYLLAYKFRVIEEERESNRRREMKNRDFSRALGFVLLAGALGLLGGFNFGSAQQANNQDSVIKSAVENKLQMHGILVDANVQVSVQNKVITLTGTVQTLALREQALKDASSVGKGYRIKNSLVLAKTDLTPEQIAGSVIKAIDNSDSYGIYDWVGLEVTKEGMVTLKGWVYVPQHRAEFVRIAQGTLGVTKVVDELTPVFGADSDNRLRLQTARLIYTRPVMRDFAHSTGPIHILVENSVVTLVGTVKTLGDRSSIENLVRDNSGALSVINELEVKEQ
jgi:osmotically-inducible protein OsmY